MKKDTPLLLSIHAQTTLGFIKDVLEGTCYMRHSLGKRKCDRLLEMLTFNCGSWHL